jgi:Skp family chaperone for outer membrane proteins
MTALGISTLLLATPCLAAGSGPSKANDTVTSTATTAPAPDEGRDQLKAKFKEQWDKLKLTQKDQRDKLKADQKDQRDKVKAEQKQQREKLKIAQHDQLRKFNDLQTETEDTTASRGKKPGTTAIR